MARVNANDFIEEDNKVSFYAQMHDNHPNYKRKIPRLEVVNGTAKVNTDDATHLAWFEKFKENN